MSYPAIGHIVVFQMAFYFGKSTQLGGQVSWRGSNIHDTGYRMEWNKYAHMETLCTETHRVLK